MIFKSFLLGIISFSMTAQAYLIKTATVFDKLVAQHGQGAYAIEMETSFHEGLDTAVMRENWLVVDGGEMRLSVTGEGGHIYRLLKRHRIFWASQGAEQADVIPPDYFMNALLTRGSTEEKRIFINWKILPPEVLAPRKSLPKIKSAKDLENLLPKTESFVRPGRVSGAPMYAYGVPAPVEGPLTPGLWVEQDAFTIRKIRMTDGAEFTGDDYAPFSKGLWFPRIQSVTFDNHTVTLRVLRLRRLTLNNEQKKQLDPVWLRSRPEAETVWPQSSLGPVIREFYTRFR